MLVANIKKYRRLYTKITTTENDNTADSSQLWTYSIPANFLKVNDIIRVKASGYFSYANSSDYIDLEVLLNSAMEISDQFGAGATFSNRGWTNEVEFIIKSIGASADIDIRNKTLFWYNTVFQNVTNDWYTSVDLTAAYSIGMNSNANNARSGTKMSCHNASVEIFRA